MNKALAIMHLFPEAEPMTDFILQDDSDGNGAYIAQWNIDAPQPTEAELEQAWADFLALPAPVPKESLEDKVTRLEAENASSTLQIIDLFEQLITKGVL
jgi:hypothetical protein